MKHIILAITFLTSFQIATGQVSNEHLDAYLWEYPLQQNLVIDHELMQEMLAEIQRIIDSGDLFFIHSFPTRRSSDLDRKSVV